MIDGNDNFKIGVTSREICKKRMVQVANSRQTSVQKCRAIIVERGSAWKLENVVLEIFTIKPYSEGAGYTEFRSLNTEDRVALDEMFDEWRVEELELT